LNGLRNELLYNEKEVTEAVFTHAFLCLKMCSEVTSPKLVKALKNMAAYGATL